MTTALWTSVSIPLSVPASRALLDGGPDAVVVSAFPPRAVITSLPSGSALNRITAPAKSAGVRSGRVLNTYRMPRGTSASPVTPIGSNDFRASDDTGACTA